MAQSQASSERAEAEIASFDFGHLDDQLTPNSLFFIRDHFAAPDLSSYDWELSFAGAVATPFEVTYGELLSEPREDLVAALECAENPVGGGLVSNAQWTGVSLARLLRKAQPLPTARFVRLWGADGDPSGNLYYTRSIPISKAVHPDTLLAHRMNGESLPASHGFPVRAVVPGWYEMDSVKWLRKVEVLVTDDDNPFMSKAYQREVRSAIDVVKREPINRMQVKSVFSRPLEGAVIIGRRFIVRGAAWAGANQVQQVELSTNGGKSWEPAQLIKQEDSAIEQAYSWVFWKYDWQIPGAGDYELIVRARDSQGRMQPAQRPKERLDPYELNGYQRVRCIVRWSESV